LWRADCLDPVLEELTMSAHNNELKHLAHGGVHLLKHAMETEHGKAVLKQTVGAAVAATVAAPLLLPVLAIGAGVTAAIWWWKKC
jgi:hypothetical protein